MSTIFLRVQGSKHFVTMDDLVGTCPQSQLHCVNQCDGLPHIESLAQLMAFPGNYIRKGQELEVLPQPFRILFVCCDDFTLIMEIISVVLQPKI